MRLRLARIPSEFSHWQTRSGDLGCIYCLPLLSCHLRSPWVIPPVATIIMTNTSLLANSWAIQ